MFHPRLHSAIFCSIVLIITGCSGFKKTAETVKEESQKSIVLISHMDGYGSGFFIDGEAGVCTVLTAKHVVPDGAKISIQSTASKIPWQPLTIRHSSNADLAVVTFKPLDGNCPFTPLKRSDSSGTSLSQTIYISSYPGGVNGQPLKQSFYISSITDKTPGSDGYEIGYKADTSGGTSGSPVLNEYGEVIAVHGRSYLSKDFIDPTGNKHVFLDLGIPISIYKQDEISRLSYSSKTSEQKSNINSGNTSKTGLDYWIKIVYIILVLAITVLLLVSPIIVSLLPKFKKFRIPLGLLVYGSFFGFTVYSSQPEHIISMYDDAIRKNPNDSFSYQMRGRYKIMLKKTESALADYNKAIQLDSGNVFAYRDRGVLKSSLGKFGDALADYNKFLELDTISKNEEKFYVYFVRGNANFYLEKFEDAISDYDRVTQQKEFDRFTVYKNRGDAKLKLGKNKDAIDDYNQAVQVKSDQAIVYDHRGIAQSNLGNRREAKIDYEKAADLYLKIGNKKSHQYLIDKIQKLGV
jgi:Trypsin-like peptidase domain/TPR repeat/Tetratricopeptide repeat